MWVSVVISYLCFIGIQKTTDYVKLNVEQSVRPQLDHLTSGDIVCMWTPVVSEFNTPGTWMSSDNSLMTINPALDIGFVGNREGVVVLTHTFLQSAPIHIQIYPVSEIEFLEDPNLVLTNGQKKSIVRVVLVLQSEKSVGIKSNNLVIIISQISHFIITFYFSSYKHTFLLF